MTIIWCMFPEVWSVTDRIFLSFWIAFCYFTPLTTRKIKILKNWKNAWRSYHFTNVYHKWQSNDVWLLRYWAQQSYFVVILDHSLPFYPPNNPIYQNFEKIKKTPGDNIILQMCTINYNHMMYTSWDIKCNRQNFSSFWTIFCPFYTSVPKIMIICHTFPEIWHVMDVIVIFYFGLFFALLPL